MFGGPVGMVAYLQRILVRQRHWIDETRFLNAFALVKALPGPTGTLMILYMGRVRGGVLGGFLAGTLFIIPSFLMMVLAAKFYTQLQGQTVPRYFLEGMQASTLGVIAVSVFSLATPYLRHAEFWIVAVLSMLSYVAQPSAEPAIIICSGLLGIVFSMTRKNGIILSISPATFTLIPVFLKAGALVFGTGLAIVPSLAEDVVQTHHWLGTQEFFDAFALGQITPGPVVITSTFIGYRVAGLTGALVATVAVFGPAFFHMLTWFPAAEKRLSKAKWIGPFVEWAVAAVLGSIVAVVGKLAMLPIQKASSPLILMSAFYFIAVVAGFSLLRKWVPVWAVIPGGGLVYVCASLFL